MKAGYAVIYLPRHWRHLWIVIAMLIRNAAVIAAINYLFSF